MGDEIRIAVPLESHDAAIVMGLRALNVILEAFPDIPQNLELIDLTHTLLDIVHESKLNGAHYGSRMLASFCDKCKAIIESCDQQEESII